MQLRQLLSYFPLKIFPSSRRPIPAINLESQFSSSCVIFAAILVKSAAISGGFVVIKVPNIIFRPILGYFLSDSSFFSRDIILAVTSLFGVVLSVAAQRDRILAGCLL